MSTWSPPWPGWHPHAAGGGGRGPVTLYVTKTLTGSAAVLSTSSTTPTTLTHEGRTTLPAGGTWWVGGCALGVPVTTGGGSSTEPPPNGHGAIYSGVTGKTIAAGTWTVSVGLKCSGPITYQHLRARIFKKAGTTYTQVGTDIVLSTFLTIPTGLHTFTASGSLPSVTFTGVHVLYLDLQGAGSSSATIIYVPVGGTHASLVIPS